MSKKQTNLIIGIVILVISIFSIFFSNNSSKFTSFDTKEAKPTPDVYEKEVVGETAISSISLVPTTIVSVTPSEEDSVIGPQQDTYAVVKVVDGDTLDVNIDGKVERLRLIGIDTPETVDPRKPVQCFGKEASNKAKELLSGQYVGLESDPTQGDKDKYGRLLRYVFLADGTNFNLYMIQEGYAHEYTYRLPYKYQSEFKQAEIDARNSNKGLWSPDTCSGDK